VTRGWRRLHNEELRNLSTSRNIIRMIRSKNVRLAGHVAFMGEMRNSHKLWSGNLKYFEDSDVIDL